MVDLSAGPTDPASRQPGDNLFMGYGKINHQINREKLVKFLRLGNGPGKSIQDKPVLGVFLVQPFFHQGQCQLV